MVKFIVVLKLSDDKFEQIFREGITERLKERLIMGYDKSGDCGQVKESCFKFTSSLFFVIFFKSLKIVET